MLIYKMLPFSDLPHRYSTAVISSITFFPHFLAMLGSIQKTTITRFVHILAAVDRTYWEHNSDELAAIDPMSPVPPPMATQRASDHMVPASGSTLEYSCDLGLGSLGPVAPKEVTADRWSTTLSLVSPSISMDPLAVPAWNEEREVRLPRPEASYN